MKNNTKRIAIVAMIAAVYVVATIGLAPISFGAVQFRISEALTLLVFFNPIFVPGLTLGVLIANFASPYGLMDMLLGTFASFIAFVLIRVTRNTINNLFVASLFPTITNGLIIPFVILGQEFTFASYWVVAALVAFGQFVVLTASYVVFRMLMKTNRPLISMLEKL